MIFLQHVRVLIDSMRLFCSVVCLVLGWARAYEYESHVLVL